MSWTDDIRCLYCDGKLPLYRKIAHGQFCSTTHRKAYWQEQERLAVDRLHQTHNALRAYRPPGAVQAILGRPEAQPEAPDPDPAGRLPQPLPCKVGTYPEIVAADPIAYEMGPRPFVLFELEVDGLPEASLAGSMPANAALYIFSTAGAPAPIAIEPATESSESREVVRPGFPDFTTAPPVVETAADSVDGHVPGLGSLAPMARPGARENVAAVLDTGTITPSPSPLRPVYSAEGQLKLAAGHLLGLSIDSIPLVQGTWIDHLDPIGLHRESAPPFMPLGIGALPASAPALHMAAGSRYPVAARQPASVPAKIEFVQFSSTALRILLPERKPIPAAVQEPRVSTPSVPTRIFVPNPSGLVPMSPARQTAKLAAESVPVPQAPLLIPQPPRTAPRVPASKLEPLDAKPIADIFAGPPVAEPPTVQPPTVEFAAVEKPPQRSPLPTTPPNGLVPPPVRKTYAWTPAVDFLRNAPRDLKMLVFAIPVLLGLALHPSLPKVSVSAPASTAGIEKNVQQAVSTELVTFRRSMLDRAAVALDEDFRSGLDDWVSRNDATAEWSFDATGFVQPGPLALYRPSLGLTDYQLQFLGMIDKKALSWVVRAADFQNYYVVKLVVNKPGPLPIIGVTRYAVINGKPDSRVDSIAPVDARSDMLYRVRLDVNGDTFVLVVQGQVIDSWSEPRLQHGGVGFFSARDESSRVRWVQVTHQYDMLGRLCAYLAPYNNTSSNGGFQP
ncbi:MAG: hypothetical protein ABSB35_06235 [Bryobacteraceae bacterium]